MDENTEQPSLTDILTSEPPAPNECPKCHKIFSNAMGLRMHDMRVHTQKLGKGYQWKKGQTHNWDSSVLEKERRARYQRKLRAKYKLQGKDSRGYPRKTGAHKWSPEQAAKFKATMRRIRRERDSLRDTPPAPMPASKRIQIVYPRNEVAQPKPNVRRMNFCPYCGENIMRHLQQERQ